MRLLSKLLVLAWALAVVSPAGADAPQRPAAGERYLLVQRDGPSLSEAVEMVRRRYPGGRIVSAQTRRSGGREVHVIKVLTQDGKVVTERIPGRVLRG